eukprot:gnl/TRDRNA2_/TRDRNA2_178454_c0_seq1.p1 gnl/TRDRNA2_/TRDRNA2_178454_c0~~gnl/TRDRNA2_/TRDRNA2_178454_c0_seq1.p1  ORF type:complete len:232 (+),score=45.68 gnl/TRDRNA2_/TRDRNA2_178454_c0_seq1:97-792(+)
MLAFTAKHEMLRVCLLVILTVVQSTPQHEWVHLKGQQLTFASGEQVQYSLVEASKQPQAEAKLGEVIAFSHEGRQMTAKVIGRSGTKRPDGMDHMIKYEECDTPDQMSLDGRKVVTVDIDDKNTRQVIEFTKQGHRWTAAVIGEPLRTRADGMDHLIKYRSHDGEFISGMDSEANEWVQLDGHFVTFKNGDKLPYQSFAEKSDQAQFILDDGTSKASYSRPKLRGSAPLLV